MGSETVLRIELHCHTYVSQDCLMRPERMISTCLARGIGALAVTDHNEFRGVAEVAKAAPFPVIPAEEIKTSEGEIIGYYLTEYIERGLSPEETAGRIREQGGIVNVPHPFDSLRNSRLRYDALQRLVGLGLVDMIEGYNARTTLPVDNEKAVAFAQEYALPVVAGSDAHTYAEIATAWVEVRPFEGSQDFLQAIRESRPHNQLSPWPVHLASAWAKVAKKLGVS